MPRARGRAGQATVEYTLLLCSTLTVTVMVGTFVQKHGRDLVESLVEKIAEAAVELAAP